MGGLLKLDSVCYSGCEPRAASYELIANTTNSPHLSGYSEFNVLPVARSSQLIARTRALWNIDILMYLQT